MPREDLGKLMKFCRRAPNPVVSCTHRSFEHPFNFTELGGMGIKMGQCGRFVPIIDPHWSFLVG